MKTITISNIEETLRDIPDNLRHRVLEPLITQHLTPISQEVILQYEKGFDRRMGFDAFKEGMNVLLLGMIDSEMSSTGERMRFEYGLPPLTNDTIITTLDEDEVIDDPNK